MRKFWKTLRVLLTAATISIGGGALVADAQAEEKLVLMTWGGTWLEFMQKGVIAPFEKETGIKVEVVTHQNTMDGLAKLKAQKDNLDVDVWATSAVPALLAAKEGLSQVIPKDKLSNASKLPPGLVTDEWIAWYRFFFGVAYDSSKVGKEITEWKDLWDPVFAGKLTVPSADNAQGKFLILLSWLGGGDESNIDPGFEQATALKPNIGTFFKTDTDQDKYLQSGEVDVATFMMVGNFLPIAEDPKMKFVAPKPFVPGAADVFALMKGKNSANAIKFIDFALGKQAQEAFAADAGVLPANMDAAAPASLAKYAPSEDQYRYVNEKVVQDSLQGWVDRWNREIQAQ